MSILTEAVFSVAVAVAVACAVVCFAHLLEWIVVWEAAVINPLF